MILTGTEITKAFDRGEINIDPYTPSQVNPNSYNLRLAPKLGFYVPDEWDGTDMSRFTCEAPRAAMLDCKIPTQVHYFDIPEEGYWLYPGKIYLGATVERTSSTHFIPMIDGRSSFARLGLSIHQTGGFGDLGFAGHWTLELACVEPIRIYAGLQICQLQFWRPYGDTSRRYEGKYINQVGPTPSLLHTELEPHGNGKRES
jgi:dCTP deaminase